MMRLLTIVISIVLLAACSEGLDTLVPKQSHDFTQNMFSFLQNGDVSAVQAKLDPGAINSDPEIRSKIEKASICLASAKGIAGTLRNWRVTSGNGGTRFAMLREYKLPDRWVFASISYRAQGDDLLITGVQCWTNTQSLDDQTRALLKSLIPFGKIPWMYIVVVSVAVVPGIIFLILVLTTRRTKRSTESVHR